MPLRRSARLNETKEVREIKVSLRKMGLYEDGMESDEVLDMWKALEESKENELERAIWQSEVTANSSTTENSSSSSSPSATGNKIIVKAVVHHEMNWSPSKCEKKREEKKTFLNRMQRKRPLFDSSLIEINSLNKSAEFSDFKRPYNKQLKSSDSGLNSSSSYLVDASTSGAGPSSGANSENSSKINLFDNSKDFKNSTCVSEEFADEWGSNTSL